MSEAGAQALEEVSPSPKVLRLSRNKSMPPEEHAARLGGHGVDGFTQDRHDEGLADLNGFGGMGISNT